MGQGGDRGVETLQRVGRPRNGPGREFRPGPGPFMLFGERGPRAVRIRAPPDPLGPQQPHRPAETRDVMEPGLPAAVPHRDDAAVRAAADGFTCLDAQNQAGPARRDRADADAFDTKKRVCPPAPATGRAASSIGHIRVPFELGNLVATDSKRP
jgi:hypothetical protein